jgi:hypothetical protein
MAGTNRAKVSQEFQRPVRPSKKLFFLNGELVRFIAANRGMNIVHLYNYPQDKSQTMLWSDFKKHGRRAYSLESAGRILGRSPKMIKNYAMAGEVPPPVGLSQDGQRQWQRRAYYSEDDLFTIRSNMATKHRGRPRKDGLTTTSGVLTENELRAKMGDALIMYTRTPAGEFIPTWQEKTY